jgi:hypothetical protein
MPYPLQPIVDWGRMIRTVVISSLLLAACDVGEIPLDGTDGGNNAGGDSNGGGNGCVDTVTPAAAAHDHGGGNTNAGMACINAGCHLAGGGGPTFTFAGTVYSDTGGTTAKPGVTIKVEFGATTVSAISDTAGNFYSMQAITLPAKTLATACPTVAPMVGQIVQGGGNCNNCHRIGGTTLPVYVQ